MEIPKPEIPEEPEEPESIEEMAFQLECKSEFEGIQKRTDQWISYLNEEEES